MKVRRASVLSQLGCFKCNRNHRIFVICDFHGRPAQAAAFAEKSTNQQVFNSILLGST